MKFYEEMHVAIRTRGVGGPGFAGGRAIEGMS